MDNTSNFKRVNLKYTNCSGGPTFSQEYIWPFACAKTPKRTKISASKIDHSLHTNQSSHCFAQTDEYQKTKLFLSVIQNIDFFLCQCTKLCVLHKRYVRWGSGVGKIDCGGASERASVPTEPSSEPGVQNQEMGTGGKTLLVRL